MDSEQEKVKRVGSHKEQFSEVVPKKNHLFTAQLNQSTMSYEEGRQTNKKQIRTSELVELSGMSANEFK